MPDTDLVIDVPVETPPLEPQTETQVAVKPEPELVRSEEPIAALKQQYEDLKKSDADTKAALAAKDAEARRHADEATRARQALAQANVAIVESNTAAIDNALAAAQTEADSAAREQVAALAAGEFEKAADLGRKAARAEARIERLSEGKADIEAQRRASQPAQTQPQPPANDFESRISNAAPRAKEWLRAHPEYVNDERKALKAAAADSLARSEGIQRETDAYFDFCERQLGLKSDPAPAQTAQPARQQSRTGTMPAAPVSRDASPTGGSTSGTQVKLTPGEQRAATDGTVVWNYTDPKIGAVKGAAVGLKEYARRKLAMTGEGRYDRSFTDQ